MSLRKALNKKFEGKPFKYETDHGGIVEGIVDTIIVGHGVEMRPDFIRYDLMVRSKNKNLYEFDRCWFKEKV